MPARGGLLRTVEPVPNPPIQPQPEEENDEGQEEEHNEDEKPQQPAIQIPQENSQEESKNVEKVEEEVKQDPVEEAESPPVKEDNPPEEMETSKDQKQDDGQNKTPKMPKSGDRRGQPKPGNQGGPPPVIATRGRGHRPSPAIRGRGGRPPMVAPRPVPTQQPIQQTEQQPVKRVEIEEEVVHEEEKKVEGVDSHESQEGPTKVSHQTQEGNLKFEGNTNFEESQRKKAETKDMFGQIFGSDEPDKNSKNRGRSPNFSEQRYATHEDEDISESYNPTGHNTERPAKTQNSTKRVNLNKTVDLFADNSGRIEAEEVENAGSETKDALNTSFGIEDASPLNGVQDNNDASSTTKIFASSAHDEHGNRSKTPPVHTRRHQLQSESNDKTEYHKPIGANHDFLIEEPVMEPDRNDQPSDDERSVETPTINEENLNNDSEEIYQNKDSDSPQHSKKVPVDVNQDEETKEEKKINIDRNKRTKILYEEDKHEETQHSVAHNKLTKGEFTINEAQDHKNSSFGGISAIGNNIKTLNMSKYDQSAPFSRTSSVKSIPDELELAYESLKNKKLECESLQKQLEQRNNELQVQKQVNSTLKIELENERMKKQEGNINAKLQAENQE